MAKRTENPLIAEAEEWLARRQQGSLPPDAQREFEAWLHSSPYHAMAYARVEESADLSRRRAAAPARPAQPRRPARTYWGMAAAVFLMLAVGVVSRLWLQPEIHQTAVGERRTVALADGSKVDLNTASKLRVDYSDQQRDVYLVEGEALFQVASDPDRPFVARAGSAAVRALGTEFNVRLRGPDMVEVTVTEGEVAVQGAVAGAGQQGSAGAPRRVPAGKGAMVGLGAVAPVTLDVQALEQRTAWRRGVIELDGETLDRAVAEFNRYRTVPLVVGDARLASIRVGGTFATGESGKFLDALQSGFGIRAVEGAGGRVYLVAAQ